MLGPGSVYTSIVPNLLIPEVREALKRTAARVVYVCNVMTQPGETDGHSAADHLRVLCTGTAPPAWSTTCWSTTRRSPTSSPRSTAPAGLRPSRSTTTELAALGVRVVHARLAREGDFFRHDVGEARRGRARAWRRPP